VYALVLAAGCQHTKDSEAGPQETWQDFMPTQTTGAQSFVSKFPKLDGRGTIVAVLDTGVDPLASGLQQTSGKKVKVIEARDFSGQGNVEMSRARLIQSDNHWKIEQGTHSVIVSKKMFPVTESQIYMGFFRETQIASGPLRDFNFNKNTKDELAVVVFYTGPSPSDLKAVIDTDADGDLRNETPVSPFHINQELITPKIRNKGKDRVNLSLAFEWDSLREIAQFHFTDGSHGTHVAGIIAGNGVFQKKQWNGIAPGAQIISLKIGNNALAGGATTTRAFKDALRFAAEYASKHQIPVVANASYGIGSAIEGRSDIDEFCNRLVQQHPMLTLSFSAGNSGPGLSSVGTPAASDLALTVGAMLPRQMVPTTYGGSISQDRMFAFSSRGGELNKPEIVAPGVASTSVPVWDGRDVKNGTSMSAPQVAGAMALVWSAIRDDKNAHSGIVRRALTYSAKKLKNYDLQSQGHGVIQVGPAIDLAKRLMKRGGDRLALGYKVRTNAPNVDGAKMPGAYWRTGIFVPRSATKTRIEVTPYLPKTVSAEERTRFRPVIRLESDKSWVKIDKPRLLFRGDRKETFHVSYNPKVFKKPGVYTARVIGRETSSAKDEVAFESWQTIIVPEILDNKVGYQRTWNNVNLEPGEVWNTFVFVPPGATTMSVKVTSDEGKNASTFLSVFNPEGHRIRPRTRWTSSEKKRDAHWQAFGPSIKSGTWEIAISGDIRESKNSDVRVHVRFSGAKYKTIKKLSKKSSERASFRAVFTNVYPKPFVGSAKAIIDGFLKKSEPKTKGAVMKINVKAGENIKSVEMDLAVSKNLYNKSTDIAVTVRNSAGKIVARDAFGSPTTKVSWSHHGKETSYTLEIEPGFTHALRSKWKVTARETQYLKEPIEFAGKSQNKIIGYPHVPTKLMMKAVKSLPSIGKSYSYKGRVVLKENKSDLAWASIPIEAKF